MIEEGSTIYIAGQISNNPNYKEQFKQAENKLLKAGYNIINPAEFEGSSTTLTDEEYHLMMRHCVMIIALRADAIGLLENWHKSKGSIKEKNIAHLLDIPVYTLDNLLSKE